MGHLQAEILGSGRGHQEVALILHLSLKKGLQARASITLGV
jgi:hypothetical protein